jgi:hypothetical protein
MSDLAEQVEAADTEHFLGNLREARQDGHELVCATCGVGMSDPEENLHDDWFECSPGHEAYMARAAKWMEQQKAKEGASE